MDIANARTSRRLVRALQPERTLVWNGRGLGRRLLPMLEEQAPTAYYVSDYWLLDLLNALQAERAIPRTGLRRIVPRALRGPERQALRLSNLAFCSAALRRTHDGSVGASSHTEIIPHGIDPALFQPVAHGFLMSPRQPRRLLFSGRLSREKGLLTLVLAFGRLILERGLTDLTLTLCGPVDDVGLFQELKHMIESTGLRDHVVLKGAVPREAMAGVIADHDVFVFPSEWDEPFSLGLLEALACGIPVVSSMTGGSPEVLVDGENAWAFRAGDVGDLVGALKSCLASPSEALRRAGNGLARVRSEFTLDRQSEAIARLLAQLP
jgi:glycosyltransferase involved in cell wall biosynthesis